MFTKNKKLTWFIILPITGIFFLMWFSAQVARKKSDELMRQFKTLDSGLIRQAMPRSTDGNPHADSIMNEMHKILEE